ncbi:hypothetical protein PYR66_15100 [Klebsiella aerogenes]|nr:hypothetical protein PYR66_15100 [Klebsiella aerogenes]
MKIYACHFHLKGFFLTCDQQADFWVRLCKYPGKPNHSLLESFRHTDYVLSSIFSLPAYIGPYFIFALAGVPWRFFSFVLTPHLVGN